MNENTIDRMDAMELADAVCGELRENAIIRGMEGRNCFGIVMRSLSDLVELGYAIANVFGTEEGVENAYLHLDKPDAYAVERYEADLRRARQGERLSENAFVDTMGLDTIVYFPRFTIDG